jgi:hypothetical protein
MVFVIEKGIPLPEGAAGRPGDKYPFKNMEVGDSFAFPKEVRAAVARSAHYYGKAQNKKFSTRAVDDTARCWRVS